MLLQQALRQLSHATASCSCRCEAGLIGLLLNNTSSVHQVSDPPLPSTSRQLHALNLHAIPLQSAVAAAATAAGCQQLPLPSLSSSLFQPALCSTTSPANHTFLRGYKSNKRTLKPLNTKASWLAVRPFLPPLSEQKAASRSRYARAPIVDTCIPPIPEVPRPEMYKRVGAVTAPYKLRPEKVFAIVELAGSQWKVTTDDVLFVNQLPHVDVNDVISLERVLLLGSRAQTVIGRPYVPGSCVLAAVEEHFRDGKVHVFKKKPKKRYQRYYGPRPNLTTLRVLQVRGIDPAPGDELALVDPLPIAYLDDSSRASQASPALLEQTELLTGSAASDDSDEAQSEVQESEDLESEAEQSEVQPPPQQSGGGGAWSEQLRTVQEQVQGKGHSVSGDADSGSSRSGDGGTDVSSSSIEPGSRQTEGRSGGGSVS